MMSGQEGFKVYLAKPVKGEKILDVGVHLSEFLSIADRYVLRY